MGRVNEPADELVDELVVSAGLGVRVRARGWDCWVWAPAVAKLAKLINAETGYCGRDKLKS